MTHYSIYYMGKGDPERGSDLSTQTGVLYPHPPVLLLVQSFSHEPCDSGHLWGGQRVTVCRCILLCARTKPGLGVGLQPSIGWVGYRKPASSPPSLSSLLFKDGLLSSDDREAIDTPDIR